MSKLRISLLGLVAMCLASMFTAAAASAAGPFWHTNGAKLKQGSVGVKLQNKGRLTLNGTVARLEVTITCGRSTSDATIDGQGETKQGQGKGFVKYEQCKTEVTGGGVCVRPETVTTNQLKSHLATGLFQGKTQIVELLEPSTSQQNPENVFARIPFNECSGTAATLAGITAPVKGSVVGVAEPQEQEGQEGSLVFPSPAITSINHEGVQGVRVGLTLSGEPTTFTGWYSARVQSGTFGVFFQ